jgi:hypothetical protein
MASKDKLKKVSATAPDTSFHFSDPLYVVFGIIEGAMSAVETSTYNFQCGRNVT